MFTDVCEITPITVNTQFGTKAEGSPFSTRCRVESEDITKRGSDGNFIQYSRLIILPAGVDISQGYKMKVVTERGISVSEEETIASYIFKVGGAVPHHVEVFCK